MYQQYQQFLVNVLQLKVLDMMLQNAKLTWKTILRGQLFVSLKPQNLGHFHLVNFAPPQHPSPLNLWHHPSSNCKPKQPEGQV